MLKLTRPQLSQSAAEQLRELQRDLDAAGGYLQRCQAVSSRWSAWKADDRKEVQSVLTQMAPSVQRCMYCLDSAAVEIEHFRPKGAFPAFAFRWDNLLWVCGGCNRTKLQQFPVRGQARWKAEEMKAAISQQPNLEQDLVGLLLDPASDDPESFLEIDIAGGTFLFVPRLGLNDDDKERAEETIRVLGLNSRSILPQIRREGFADLEIMMDAAQEWIQTSGLESAIDQFESRLNGLRRMLWREVWRQRAYPNFQNDRFNALPDEFVEAVQA